MPLVRCPDDNISVQSLGGGGGCFVDLSSDEEEQLQFW